MAAKLGEELVEKGLITGAQLEEALRCQVIFGGRLGTNLLEMGALSEPDLTAHLGRRFGVPAARLEQFQAIPAQVVGLLSADLAERHQAVPLELNNRRLTLAMSNPADLAAVDDIAFRTGLVIRPVVAPEVRIVLALERYYQIPRRLRYIHATPERRKTAPASTRKAAPAPSAAAPATKPRPPATPTPARPKAAQTAPPAPPPAADEAILELEEEITSALEAREMDLESFSRRLTEAGDRQDIADALIRYLGQHFRCSCLFLVRGESAMGWFGIHGGALIEGLEELDVPLAEPSFLKTVAESRSYVLGPVPRSPFNSMILQKVAGEIPPTALAVPLMMMGRVMAVLYVHGCKGSLAERVADLQTLIGKTVMAFEILVLKNKILSP